MSSNFDPEQFLNASLTQPLTKRPPADAGKAYPAVIGEPKIRAWQSDKGGESRSGFALDIPLEIQLPEDVAQRVGQPKITINDSVFLDNTPAGGLDMAPGRNRGLRRYYEATGLNKPGTSPRTLQGHMLLVMLKHDVAKDGSGDIYERVDSIAKA